MSRAVVVKSFAELAELLGPEDRPADPAADPSAYPPTAGGPTANEADLAVLLANLEEAGKTLGAVARRDREAKESALRELERYDAVAAQQREAEQARDRARQVRVEAEALAKAAFGEEARAAAQGVVALAARVERAAAGLCEQRSAEVHSLAAGLDLERLLAERRREEEAEKARAAEADKARRLAGAIAEAKRALAAGRLEEARALLEPVASENPGNPEVASLRDTIAQREVAVKATAAEEALWAARREHRRDLAAAVARLEAVDLTGLPEELVRQVFGEWARACARLCRERGAAEPLRYAPDPGRGAILARESAGGGYVVVSALGMGAGWRPGSAVGERQLRRARPLR